MVQNRIKPSKTKGFGSALIRKAGEYPRPLLFMDGEITNWVKQLGNTTSTTQTVALSYDHASQLCGGTTTYGDGSPSQATTFVYDEAGNRTQETHTVGSSQAGSFTNKFGTNNLNQLTNITSNPLQLQFTVNQSASVTVNSAAVTANANGQYCTTLPPTAGSQTPVTVEAVSPSGRVKIQKANILNTPAYVYDANGYLIRDDQKTYTWDGANRLVQVNLINAQPTTIADTIQMTYDGTGRRVGITELHGTTVLTQKTFVWCGQQLCQERDVTGKTITKRFFAQGEQVNGTNYYYTRDHLGSVREVTNATGVVQGQYDYDLYGRQTQLAGTFQGDFGYTGFYVERAAGLDLTWYRAYDPEKGRWIGRDPAGDFTGPNLYSYVSNNTIKLADFDGRGEFIPEPPFYVPDEGDYEALLAALEAIEAEINALQAQLYLFYCNNAGLQFIAAKNTRDLILFLINNYQAPTWNPPPGWQPEPEPTPTPSSNSSDDNGG